MARWSGSRKYGPLAVYLAELDTDRVTLTLAEVEAILGTPLPMTARRSDWWANRREAYSQAWRDVGWQPVGLQRWAGGYRRWAVTFVRLPPDSTA